ncbi:unnamed protein product [Paramecium sonneborni]|uniref:Uncharacterized protein n=1 Tax=Paramecium sonneborni TaxID=65129 RepID=A0A8S1P3N9_9CILI|nr:unnamed protein product [Paramecium sonneborni]
MMEYQIYIIKFHKKIIQNQSNLSPIYKFIELKILYNYIFKCKYFYQFIKKIQIYSKFSHQSIMIISLVLVYITHQTLVYQFDASSNVNNGWDTNNNKDFFACDGIHYFGLDSGVYFLSQMFYDLEPHSHVMVEAKILSVDGNNILTFGVEAVSINYVSDVVSENSICGATNQEYEHTISITWQHNRRTVSILILSDHGGLISLSLSILRCQYDCAGCIENYDMFCLSWIMHSYFFSQKLIQISDGWTFGQVNYIPVPECDNCQFLEFKEIQYSTQLPPHQDVLIRFFKLSNNIIVDYFYSKQTISSSNQQIEILIRNHKDLILQLIIKTEQSDQVSYIRDFDIFYTQPEKMFNNLNAGCLEQVEDRCMICQEGWTYDELLENCNPVCGDGIIQGQEECDDGNIISNDSCYLCKYKCIDFCKTCQFGICLECQDGFNINSNFTCNPICGDGELIPYSAEQCELTENGVWDGCQDCRFISVAHCKTTYQSICLECELGYQNQEYICLPYCGDTIILEEYEDCDDGNEQPYDGCFQCKFQCIEGCNICDRGQCILKCEDGYKFVNNSCLSICGDQVITKEEDCDDGNLRPYDGCFNCKYSCPENCYYCHQGTCLECNNQYQLLESNQCKQELQFGDGLLEEQDLCGDGLLSEQEQCDDGNSQAADGCFDCLIEQNWICITITIDSPSQCTFIKAPSLIVNYLNITQNKQYISISFDQRVKIQTAQPLSETINLQLLNIDENKWNSSLYILQDVGSDVSFGEFIAQVEVYQLLEFRPVLKIQISQTVSNINNAVLENVEKSIILQYPTYLDQKQKEYSLSLKNLNQNVIYSLSRITGLGLLLGQDELFFEKILRFIFRQMICQQLNLFQILFNFLSFQSLLILNKMENIIMENLMLKTKTQACSSIFHANYFNSLYFYQLFCHFNG